MQVKGTQIWSSQRGTIIESMWPMPCLCDSWADLLWKFLVDEAEELPPCENLKGSILKAYLRVTEREQLEETG
jgi:hypothetical protein